MAGKVRVTSCEKRCSVEISRGLSRSLPHGGGGGGGGLRTSDVMRRAISFWRDFLVNVVAQNGRETTSLFTGGIW